MPPTDPEPHIHLDIPLSVARDWASANLPRHAAASQIIDEQIDAALLVHAANQQGADDLLATLAAAVDAQRAEIVPADDPIAWPGDVILGGPLPRDPLYDLLAEDTTQAAGS